MYGRETAALGQFDAAALKEAQYRSEMNAAATCDAPRETAFHATAHTLAMVGELRNRIGQITERLVGPEPKNEKTQAMPCASGLLGALEHEARCTKDVIVDIHGMLSRIERAIG